MKIEELNLTMRTYNCLKRSGIDTVDQLHRLSDNDLRALRCIGPKAIAEVREKLKKARPQTNADRIRSMTDEELAELIMCPYNSDGEICEASKDNCMQCCLRWLRQPAKEDNHE